MSHQEYRPQNKEEQQPKENVLRKRFKIVLHNSKTAGKVKYCVLYTINKRLPFSE